MLACSLEGVARLKITYDSQLQKHSVDFFEKCREKAIDSSKKSNWLLDPLKSRPSRWNRQKERQVTKMAMVRNEKLVPMVEEKQIDWLAPNGNWQIIGKVMQDPMDSSFPHRSINIYRYDKKHRKMLRFHLGLESKIMPDYVLQMYNEIHDKIRGRERE